MLNPPHRVARLPLLGISAVCLTIAGCADESEPDVDAIALADQCTLITANPASYSGELSDTVTLGDAVRYNVTTQPQLGTVAYDQSAGGFTYTPNGPERGYRDSFTVEVEGSDGSTDTADIDIIFGAKRIMPMGDSITFGVTTHELGVDGPTEPLAVGYRGELYNLLTDAGYAVDFVGDSQAGTAAGIPDADHNGYPGENTEYFKEYAFLLLDEDSADIVLMHIGTNDVAQGSTDTTNLGLTLSQIDAWAMLDDNADTTTFVAKLIPSLNATRDAGITTFNAGIQALMDASWPNLPVVDMNAALTAAIDLTPLADDTTGLHPNATGYSKMATTWFDALEASGELHSCSS